MLFDKLLGQFSRDMGIDLGTANTLVYVKDKGIVINEPSVVAVNLRSDQILAVGEDAKRMLGKTPMHIAAIRPLEDGVISDFEVAEKMLKHFIEKVHRESFNLRPRPRIVMGIPMEVTEVERKAVEDAALSAGAREVFLVEEPIASAVGARLPIYEPTGHMIVDIGGGTTEIAVISLGGIVTKKSLRIAGAELDENIMTMVRENFSLLLGERTAEEIKIKIGSAYELDKPLEYKVSGRDLLTGFPKEISINDSQVREALKRSLRTIVDNIKATVESTPPELVADIYRKGILLTGGGALLRNLDKLIFEETKIPVHIIDDPLTSVVRGTGIILEELPLLKDILLSSAQESY